MTEALYKVLEESTIDGTIYRAGAENVPYAGVPDASNLKPLNAKAKANMEAADKIRKDKSLDVDEKQEALRELDDKLRGIGDFANRDDADDESEDPALVKHAEAAAKEHEKAQIEDGNFTRIKLQGENDPAPAARQGGSSKK